MLSIVLIIFLVLMVMGTIPVWPYSRNYGYYPSTIGGVILAVVVILLLQNNY